MKLLIILLLIVTLTAPTVAYAASQLDRARDVGFLIYHGLLWWMTNMIGGQCVPIPDVFEWDAIDVAGDGARGFC